MNTKKTEDTEKIWSRYFPRYDLPAGLAFFLPPHGGSCRSCSSTLDSTCPPNPVWRTPTPCEIPWRGTFQGLSICKIKKESKQKASQTLKGLNVQIKITSKWNSTQELSRIDGIHHHMPPIATSKGALNGLFTSTPRVRQNLRHVRHHLATVEAVKRRWLQTRWATK